MFDLQHVDCNKITLNDPINIMQHCRISILHTQCNNVPIHVETLLHATVVSCMVGIYYIIYIYSIHPLMEPPLIRVNLLNHANSNFFLLMRFSA